MPEAWASRIGAVAMIRTVLMSVRFGIRRSPREGRKYGTPGAGTRDSGPGTRKGGEGAIGAAGGASGRRDHTVRGQSCGPPHPRGGDPRSESAGFAVRRTNPLRWRQSEIGRAHYRGHYLQQYSKESKQRPAATAQQARSALREGTRRPDATTR